MQLVQDLPDFRYVLRAVAAGAVTVNEQVLTRSFLLAPDALVEGWPHADPLVAADMDAVLALGPELVLLRTGERHRFPAPAVMARTIAARTAAHAFVRLMPAFPSRCYPRIADPTSSPRRPVGRGRSPSELSGNTDT